jgi:myo-inositol-1(or 4)-monophosphatase
MYGELLDLARKVGSDAAAFLMERPLAFEIEEKSTAIDIVTQMDKAAEKFIVQSLLTARPDDGMIGEEGAAIESKSGITWVIDPLDGTVNYFYGLPGWNVSIAAKDKEGSVVGVVSAPTINSTWWASRGEGAFYNGKKIKVNNPVEFDRALIGLSLIHI